MDNRLLIASTIAAAVLLAAARPAAAQNSSLYSSVQQRQPLTLSECSWIYQKPEDPRMIKLHDHVVVMVNEKSVMTSDGLMDRKKKAYGDLKLPDWIHFRKGHLVPDPQSSGDPHIRGEVDNKMRSEAQFETKDSLSFRIACTVVDIRPNGNLVIEGHRTIRNNEEEWDYGLRGEIRPEAILPNNTVLSENVAEMRIDKREKGHVRDAYRRGWALEWLDKWQPF